MPSPQGMGCRARAYKTLRRGLAAAPPPSRGPVGAAAPRLPALSALRAAAPWPTAGAVIQPDFVARARALSWQRAPRTLPRQCSRSAALVSSSPAVADRIATSARSESSVQPRCQAQTARRRGSHSRISPQSARPAVPPDSDRRRVRPSRFDGDGRGLGRGGSPRTSPRRSRSSSGKDASDILAQHESGRPRADRQGGGRCHR